MNQPDAQTAPNYVTCPCQHCDGHIEFDANEFAEENSIVPCPHCGLETKIFIPISQAEKIPPKLPSSVASPNTARREGFFWGTSEILQERVGDEYPVATAPDLTEAQIRSVGKRQNDDMRPRCVQLARVLKKTGSFYYHCDWHASHYVKGMLDQIFWGNNFQNEIVCEP
jgi:hypothetical protein